MIITKKHLHRRSFLHGIGATVALPMLDAMMPALAAPAVGGSKPAVRLCFVYVPNGIIMDRWKPSNPGRDFQFNVTNKVLEPFRENLNMISTRAGKRARPR